MSTSKIIAVVFLSLLLTLSLFAFGFLFTMKMTALSAGYVNSRIDSLPLALLVEEVEFDETIKDNPGLVNFIKNFTDENEVELKERVKKSVYIIYDYLNGKSEELDMALVLKENILDPNSDIPSDVAKSLTEIEETLSESRQYVGVFNTVYGLLIGFIVLIIAGIILIYREVKGASRTLGGIFLGYGIINLITVFIARGTASKQISQLDDVPLSVQTWLTQFATSSLTPLLILAVVLLVVGAALLTTSFIYKRNQPQTGTLE